MTEIAHTTAGAGITSKGGDAEAFAEHFSQARVDRAYALASAVLSDSSADAEDAVHDAAVRAWTHWGDLRDRNAFDAWFDRILVNTCRDRMRVQRRLARIRLEPAEHPNLAVGDRLGALEESFERLSPDHRIVVALRYLDDLSLDEIAHRTHANLGTVKSRLHYALRLLRADYEAARRRDGSI